jgi:hypothetical protein
MRFATDVVQAWKPCDQSDGRMNLVAQSDQLGRESESNGVVGTSRVSVWITRAIGGNMIQRMQKGIDRRHKDRSGSRIPAQATEVREPNDDQYVTKPKQRHSRKVVPLAVNQPQESGT